VEEAVVVVVEAEGEGEGRKLVRGPEVEEAVVVVARILFSGPRTVLSGWVAHILTSPDPVRRTTAATSVEDNDMVISFNFRRFGGMKV
jgi:hypothetical protein